MNLNYKIEKVVFIENSCVFYAIYSYTQQIMKDVSNSMCTRKEEIN